MNEALIFYALKCAHIGALILWLGPSIGAWWVLKVVHRDISYHDRFSHIVHRAFIHMLTLEHIALFVLLGSGVAMALLFQFYTAAWLQWKVGIILLLIVPLEIADIYWGNIRLASFYTSLQRPHSVSTENNTSSQVLIDDEAFRATLNLYHRQITWSAIIILPPSIAAIFFLVIAKPSLPSIF